MYIPRHLSRLSLQVQIAISAASMNNHCQANHALYGDNAGALASCRGDDVDEVMVRDKFGEGGWD